MNSQNRLNKHRKGSQLLMQGYTSERILKSQRAFSNEEGTKKSYFDERNEQEDIDQEKFQLNMIKKELIQFQQDLQFMNFGQKKRNIREFKETVEVFMHAVRFLIIKQQKDHQNSLNKPDDGSVNENDKTFPQENSIFQQNEETSILLKDQDRKILFGTSVKKESSMKYNNNYADEQLNELQELLQILDECISELSIIIEQKSLLKEDALSYQVREAEYVQQIEFLEEKIRFIQNSKVLQGQNFVEFNKDIKLKRIQNIVQFYQKQYDSIKTQMNNYVFEIQQSKTEIQKIQQEYSQFVHIKRELSLMKDGFIIGDRWMLELFDIEFILNIMDKKKNEEIVLALVRLQNYFIQELEHLMEEKSKGCFSIYESLLNIYDASNHHLVKAFSENPVLEFQQKLFLERQQKIAQITNEKISFIQEVQNKLLQNFPKLKEFVENFRNSQSSLCLAILENKNNQNLLVLFKLLNNQFKQKLSQDQYNRVVDNFYKQSQLQIIIEKSQSQLNKLEDKAVSLKIKLNKFKSVEESLINNYSRFKSPTKIQQMSKFDILEDVKLNLQARKYVVHSQSQNDFVSANKDQGFSFADDRKNYIQHILEEKSANKSRNNSNHKSPSMDRSPQNKSPYSSRLDNQWSLTKAENHEEYQYEKAKKKCEFLAEEIQDLEIKRQTNNMIVEDTLQKEHKRLSEKEKFLASSIYRTLKLIKFKFEIIHNHQQSSYFSINSYGQAKFNTEERDRVIYQLLGEANMLCQDYETNFQRLYSNLTGNQVSQNLIQEPNSSSISHKLRNKSMRSQSACKLSSTQNLLNKSSSRSILKNKETPLQLPSIPLINPPSKVISQKCSPENKKKSMQRCQSFVESQVQRILSSQKTQFSKENSSQQNNQFSTAQSQQEQILPKYSMFYTQNQQQLDGQKQQNLFYSGSDSSSVQSTPSATVKQKSYQQKNIDSSYYYLENKQKQDFTKLKPDIQSDSASVMFGSPNSSHSYIQSSSSSSLTIYQNLSSIHSQNSKTDVNKSSNQNINNSGEEHKYSKQKKNNNSLDKNFIKKTETVNIKQLLNQNNSFSSNVSLTQIKNLIQSPDSKSKLNSNYNLINTKNNQSLSSQQSTSNLKQQHSHQTVLNQSPMGRQFNQSPENTKGSQQNILNQSNRIGRNKTMYVQSKQSNNYQVAEISKQTQNYYQISQNTSDYYGFNNKQERQTDQLSLNNSQLNGKPKFGVVSINITQIEQQQKENVSRISNSESCSTIEQEQQNQNVQKIHSTLNKNLDQVQLLEGDDFVKFSFNNNNNILSQFNYEKQQTKSKTPSRQNKMNNNNTNNNNSNFCNGIFTCNNKSSSESSSIQDKENNFIQSLNQSKEPKQMKQNQTHKRLSSLLQAATQVQNNSKKKTMQMIDGTIISNQNQNRVIASKYPQCKSPLSKDTSIYEGSNETQSNMFDSSSSNFQSNNKIVSARNNNTVCDGQGYFLSPKKSFNNVLNIQNCNSINDIENGIPVYVRFNSQMLLKKKVFDPLKMTVKDALNLGYIYRIMKFNKNLNRLEFYRERITQKQSFKNTNQAGNYQILSPKNQQLNSNINEIMMNTNMISNQIENNDDKRLVLEKFISLSQIKKVSIPENTQNLYKFQNGQQLNKNLYMDENNLLHQNNYLLCIDGKDSGLTEFIVNSFQTYQITYNSLNSLLTN